MARLKITIIISSLLALASCSGTGPYRGFHGQRANPDVVIQTARAQLGTDYRFGGDSPTQGFDCSGLVYYSYRKAGVHIPRTTFGQFKQSRPVARRELKQGDLVFFRVSRSRISHVGIYLGKNRFIHAPSRGKSVSIARLDHPYWQKRYIRAGRL